MIRFVGAQIYRQKTFVKSLSIRNMIEGFDVKAWEGSSIIFFIDIYTIFFY
jgi:hypothetical protein